MEVFQTLCGLDPNKTSGVDSICPALLKYCAEPLAAPIQHLFTPSLNSHSLPQEWHTHCIIPVFKSGDRCLIKNYGPISLLCIISKVLEKIVHQRLFEFLFSRLSLSQFGFIPGRSCLQQLLIFSYKLYQAKSSHFDGDVIYLDYKKAFDSVVHNRLLYKLWVCGIRGDLWKWFRAYLTSRRQCVRVDGQLSCFLPVISGVPQGSLLGPLFYIIFINDMFSNIREADALAYADDTKLLMIIQDISDCAALQDDINEVSEWGGFSELFLNSSKCYQHEIHYLYHFHPSFLLVR